MTLRVEIAWNNAAVASVCGACGARIDPFIGYEPFIAGTWDLVCHDCAARAEIVSSLPDGFRLFDQSGIAAELEEMSRERFDGPRVDDAAPTPSSSDDPVEF